MKNLLTAALILLSIQTNFAHASEVNPKVDLLKYFSEEWGNANRSYKYARLAKDKRGMERANMRSVELMEKSENLKKELNKEFPSCEYDFQRLVTTGFDLGVAQCDVDNATRQNRGRANEDLYRAREDVEDAQKRANDCIERG